MKSKSQKFADQAANEPLEPTRFFAITEVAEMVGVSTRSVRRWIKRDELAAHRFGASVRIAESDLRAFFSHHRGKANDFPFCDITTHDAAPRDNILSSGF